MIRLPIHASPFLALALLATLTARAQDKPEKASSYLVLLVTGLDGKSVHKPLADKDQTGYRKGLEEEFQKARKAHQEEKKAFQKENPGKKFEKAEPQKPRFQPVKRDIKSLNEARRIALDLDKELEKGKGKNGKNGNGKNGKSGKAEKEKEKDGNGEKKQPE